MDFDFVLSECYFDTLEYVARNFRHIGISLQTTSVHLYYRFSHRCNVCFSLRYCVYTTHH